MPKDGGLRRRTDLDNGRITKIKGNKKKNGQSPIFHSSMHLVLDNIFVYLPKSSLCSCSHVNKFWYSRAQKQIFHRTIKLTFVQGTNTADGSPTILLRQSTQQYYTDEELKKLQTFTPEEFHEKFSQYDNFEVKRIEWLTDVELFIDNDLYLLLPQELESAYKSIIKSLTLSPNLKRLEINAPNLDISSAAILKWIFPEEYSFRHLEFFTYFESKQGDSKIGQERWTEFYKKLIIFAPNLKCFGGDLKFHVLYWPNKLCRQIDNLHLFGSDEEETKSKICQRIMKTAFSNLKQLKIVTTKVDCNVLSKILQKCSSTLQFLSLEEIEWVEEKAQEDFKFPIMPKLTRLNVFMQHPNEESVSDEKYSKHFPRLKFCYSTANHLWKLSCSTQFPQLNVLNFSPYKFPDWLHKFMFNDLRNVCPDPMPWPSIIYGSFDSFLITKRDEIRKYATSMFPNVKPKHN